MTKSDFLERLEKALSGLPEDDLRERLAFYAEMIDDRIEEGLSEESAVGDVGFPDEIAWQIIAEYPLHKLVKKKMKPNRKLCTWEIVLLAVGSPIWLSLGASVLAVAFSLYVSVWAIIVSLWAVFGSLVGVAVGGVVGGIIFCMGGNVLSGIGVFSLGLVSAGLSIFAFFGCNAATKGIIMLTKKIVVGIKGLIMGKGNE